MAADDTAALVVAMSAQLTKFEKDLDQAYGMADKGVRRIEDRFKQLNPSSDNLGEFLGLLGKAAALGGLTEAITKLAEMNEQVAHLGESAQRVGLSTDQFQQLRYAIVATGGSLDQADSFLNQFSRRVSEAANGTGQLYNFFRVNNVALREANGQLKPLNELLNTYADLVKNTKDPQDRLNEGFMAGGRQAGPALVNALKDGSEGLKRFAADADAAGIVIDAALIERARRTNVEWQKLKLQISTFFETIAVSAAESIHDKNAEMDNIGKGWSDAIKHWWLDALKFIETNNPDVSRMVKNLRDALNNTPITVVDPAGNFVGPGGPRRGSDINAPLTAGGADSRAGPGPDSTGDGTTKQFNVQAEALRKLIEEQEHRIATLNVERDTVGKTAAEEAYYKTKIDLTAQAKKEHIALTPQVQAAIEAEAQKTRDAQQSLDNYKREWQGLNSVMQFAGNEIIGVLDGLTSKTMSLGDAMRKLALDILHAVEQALLLGSGPLAQFFGLASNVSGGTGGLFGALFSGFFKSGGGSAPASVPFFAPDQLAEGTDFAEGGPTVVGEHGVELVNMPRGAQVIPNHVLRAASAAVSPTVRISIDLTGANGDAAIAAAAKAAALKGAALGIAQSNAAMPSRLETYQALGT